MIIDPPKYDPNMKVTPKSVLKHGLPTPTNNKRILEFFGTECQSDASKKRKLFKEEMKNKITDYWEQEGMLSICEWLCE